MLSIAELKKAAAESGSKPYDKPKNVRCTVLIMEGDTIVIGDESDTLKLGIRYMKPQEREKLKVGNLYYITHVTKGKALQYLFANEKSKVSYGGYNMDKIPTHIQEQASQSIHPRTPPRSPIKGITPGQSLVSIEGVVKTVSDSISCYIISDIKEGICSLSLFILSILRFCSRITL